MKLARYGIFATFLLTSFIAAAEKSVGDNLTTCAGIFGAASVLQSDPIAKQAYLDRAKRTLTLAIQSVPNAGTKASAIVEYNVNRVRANDMEAIQTLVRAQQNCSTYVGQYGL